MPTGKVKFFDDEKGFGFIASDDGSEVFLHASALPAGVTSVKPGSRVEFGVAEGKKGAQALSIRILDEPVSLSKRSRKPAEEMAIITEDLIRLLDKIGGDFKHGKIPEATHASKIASLLRKLAEELDA